jgi:hypothetical protein
MQQPKTAQEQTNATVIREPYASAEAAAKDTPKFVSYFGLTSSILAPMGGVRDSGWGRTGPRSLDDFSDLIWINSHSGQRQYPF